MPWQMLWPDFLKKRLCRYLLQHYLGHFFKEKISLEQLFIDIYNGTGCVKNLNLDCEALNEQLNAAASGSSMSASPAPNANSPSSIPIEIVSGFDFVERIESALSSLLSVRGDGSAEVRALRGQQGALERRRRDVVQGHEDRLRERCHRGRARDDQHR